MSISLSTGDVLLDKEKTRMGWDGRCTSGTRNDEPSVQFVLIVFTGAMINRQLTGCRGRIFLRIFVILYSIQKRNFRTDSLNRC